VDNYETFNEVLVRLFRDIMDIEQKAIITPEFRNITNNDMHVIEAIGIGAPKNMSAIARELSVTVGTLTIAMNSLVKKGYVVRARGKEDRRIVYISLSDKGRRAYEHHAEFHRQMIDSIKEDASGAGHSLSGAYQAEPLVQGIKSIKSMNERGEHDEKINDCFNWNFDECIAGSLRAYRHIRPESG
jgi:DNA-binding MarR family transcriptional regulator